MTIDPGDLLSGTEPALPGPGNLVPASLAGGPGRPEPEEAGLPHEAVRRIGRNLRLLYADVLDQPIPERFGTLLDALARTGDAPASPSRIPSPATDARGSR